MKSRQEVFNAAYRGLRAQKWGRSTSAASSFCKYNGEGGAHCAIGWVFSVPARCEGHRVFGLPEDVIPRDVYDSLGHEFLGDLQAAHDSSWSPEDMRELFTRLAVEYDLEIPPDDGQDPVLVP